MLRLLLTGGSGMVGRNIQSRLRDEGWVVDAPSSRQLNLTNAADVDFYLKQYTPDLVVHAAGRVGGIQANMTNPVSFLEENIAIGRNVIMGAYKAGVRNFINLASTCMYPHAAQNPLDENMILTGALEPTNEGYALAKIMTTRLCEYICREDSHAQFKTLIPCNLYGPYDKFDPKNSHLVPAIIHKVHLAKINREPIVEIWGDGTARREFMYAPDLADAVLKAVRDISVVPSLMNIGHGFDHSINDYYQAVASVIGWQGQFDHDYSKPVGMKQKLCDVTRSNAWGWTPSTSLIDGITKTYDYYLKRVAL